MVVPTSQLVKKIYNNVPVRFNVGVMLFMACFITYMLRVNLSINILAMVQSPGKNATELPDYGPRYEWTAHDQSLLLGSYFWGYLVTSLPGGMLAEKFGGRQVTGITMILSLIFTGLTPLVAGLGFWWVFAMRFIVGAVAGPIYPALHNLISKWAPPDEKGKFIASLLGGAFGTVVTWPLMGVLIENLGWVYAFYIPAAITAVMTVVWYILVHDSPETHPRISKEEIEYIQKSLGDSISKEKVLPPFLKFVTSLPFLSLLLLHYGNLWGLYFLITAAPKFLNTVLGFNLAKAGFLSALPYLARMTMGFIFGSVGDSIRKRNMMSITAIRKFFTIFSHIIPGLFLIGLCFVGYHPYICVAIITLSLGFNGSSTLTNLQNSQDLAPNFAGTLYGIINFVGTTAGFITPSLVAFFTQENNTLDEWSYVFMVGAAAYIIPALIFAVFGSGNVQPWNEPKKKDDSPS